VSYRGNGRGPARWLAPLMRPYDLWPDNERSNGMEAGNWGECPLPRTWLRQYRQEASLRETTHEMANRTISAGAAPHFWHGLWAAHTAHLVEDPTT